MTAVIKRVSRIVNSVRQSVQDTELIFKSCQVRTLTPLSMLFIILTDVPHRWIRWIDAVGILRGRFASSRGTRHAGTRSCTCSVVWSRRSITIRCYRPNSTPSRSTVAFRPSNLRCVNSWKRTTILKLELFCFGSSCIYDLSAQSMNWIELGTVIVSE